MEKSSIENLKTESNKDSKGDLFTDEKSKQKTESNPNGQLIDSNEDIDQI